MGTRIHRSPVEKWGRKIPARSSSSYGLVYIQGKEILVQPPSKGLDSPFPNINSEKSARKLTEEGKVFCLYPGCGPYKYASGGGPKRRAAFTHPAGKNLTQHVGGDETIDHLESKAAILTWILSKYGNRVIDSDLDKKYIKNPSTSPLIKSGSIKPDAWVKFDTGTQIAIEFQHSPGDASRIEEKTILYSEHKIVVWWIFSARSESTCLNIEPVEAKLRGRKYAKSIARHAVDTSPTQRRLIAEEIPFFWFDRETQLIGTPAIQIRHPFAPEPGEAWDTQGTQLTRRSYAHKPVATKSDWVQIIINSLESCEIDLETGELITLGTKAIERGKIEAQKEESFMRSLARKTFANKRKAMSVDSIQKETNLSPPPESDENSNHAPTSIENYLTNQAVTSKISTDTERDDSPSNQAGTLEPKGQKSNDHLTPTHSRGEENPICKLQKNSVISSIKAFFKQLFSRK
ncbi:competence protein CoiA family protein [Dermabacteraceae bacterium P7054]